MQNTVNTAPDCSGSNRWLGSMKVLFGSSIRATPGTLAQAVNTGSGGTDFPDTVARMELAVRDRLLAPTVTAAASAPQATSPAALLISCGL